MQFFTFGLTRSGRSLGDHEFFGTPLRTIDEEDIAVFGVESRGEPARTDEVLISFDEAIRHVADVAPVLPHRFGVVTNEDAVRSDLVEHAEIYRDALDRVEGRDEWTVRIRPRVDDVLSQLTETEAHRLRSFATPLDRGAAVHQILAGRAEQESHQLVELMTELGWQASPRSHDDGLGVDVHALAERGADIEAETERMTESLRRLADVELVGPGPAYRFAALITNRLTVLSTRQGARR